MSSASGKDSRWRDDEALKPEVRELLESAKGDEPSPEQLSALQANIAFLFALPPGGGGAGPAGGEGGGAGPTGHGGAATTAGTGGASAAGAGITAKTVAGAATAAKGVAATGAGKALLLATVSTLAVGGAAGSIALSKRNQAPVILQVSGAQTTPAPTPTLVEPTPSLAPAEPMVSVPAPPVKVKPAPPLPPPPEPVKTVPEAALLQQALDAIHSGQAGDALAAAAAHATRFPDSPLAQEREAVAIEALVKLKRNDEARDRAASFHAKWPTSLHLSKIDALIGER